MAEKDLAVIFRKLKTILEKYKGPFVTKLDLDDKYDLWSIRDVEIDGRKRNEVYFAGLIIQGNYVGFYYMPIYVEADARRFFKPELLGLLKGKSCFHIRQLDETIEQQVSEALEKGFNLYKKRGWV